MPCLWKYAILQRPSSSMTSPFFRSGLPSPTGLSSRQVDGSGTGGLQQEQLRENVKENCWQSQINKEKESWGKDGVPQKGVDEKERKRGELYKREDNKLGKTYGLKVEQEEDLVEGIYSEPTPIMPQPKETQQETPLTRHSAARWIFLMLASRSPLDHFLSRSSLKRSDSYKAARPILSPEVVRRSVESSTVSSAVTSPDTSVI